MDLLLDTCAFMSDPFDRLIISQAKLHGFSVVTDDENFPNYGVPIVW